MDSLGDRRWNPKRSITSFPSRRPFRNHQNARLVEEQSSNAIRTQSPQFAELPRREMMRGKGRPVSLRGCLANVLEM